MLIIFFAATFHPYILLFLLMPLLRFKPWTGGTWILLLTAVGAGLFLPQIIGTVVDAAALLGDGYDATKFIGEGVNIFRVLVASVSVLLTLVFRRLVIGNDTQDNIFMQALCLLAFSVLQTTLAVWQTISFFFRRLCCQRYLRNFQFETDIFFL